MQSFNLDAFIEDYNKNFNIRIEEFSGDNVALVFTIDGESVVIGHMPVPIPRGDIEETAKYAYNWLKALEEINEHKGHLIVSIVEGGKDQIKRFKIFTQVLSSLLRITTAIGVYIGNQSLLISKEGFLKEAILMSDDYLPLNLWIYFGLRITNKGNSGYTYGLKEFNKTELEILNSSKSLENIRAFLFDVAHYVLDCNVTFQEGQTVGITEEERIRIALSKGELVESDTFKLTF